MPGILQIGATVNVAELKAGMEDAAATTKGTAAQMSTAFQGLAAESRASTTQIASNWVAVAQASLGLRAAQADVRSATRAAKDAEDEDTASLARLALAKREAALASAALAAAEKAATGATTGFGQGASGASMLVRGLGQEVGVKMPRFLASFVGQMEGVAPLLMAAFPVIAAVAFIEVLARIPDTIEKGINKLRGWDEEAKKDFKEEAEFADRLQQAIHGQGEAFRKLGSEGLTGIAKLSADIKANRQNFADNETEIDHWQKKVEGLKAFRDAIKLKASDIIPAVSGDVGTLSKLALGEERDKAEEELNLATKRRNDLKLEEIRLSTDLAELQAKAGADRHRELLDDDKATIDAEKKTALERLATRAAGIKQARQLGKISAQDELEDLNTIADLKLAAEQRYLDRMQLLLAKEHAAGKNVTPELTGLQAESSDASLKNDAEKAANQARFDEQAKRQAREIAMAKIDAAESVSEAQVRLDDQTARESFTAHKISSQQETNLLETAENERFTAHQAKLQAQLAEDLKEPEKYAKEIVTINGEIEAGEKDHQAKLAAIRAEGTRKAIEEENRRAEETAQTQEKLATRVMESTIRLDNDRLKHGEMTIKQWADSEIAAVENWAAREEAILDRQAAVKARLYGQDSIEYQRVEDRKVEIARQAESQIEQIQQREEDRWLQLYRSMSSTAVQALNKILTSHKNLGQDLIQLWNGLMMDLIKFGEQWLISYGENLLKQKVLDQIFGVQKKTADGVNETTRVAQHVAANAQIQGQDVLSEQAQVATATATQTELNLVQSTGLAARQATLSAANLAAGTSEAALAAAGAFASIMVAVPFPENVAAAPVGAAASFAEGMGWASLAAFETGGIIPRTGMVLAHEKEGILPRPLTSMLLDVANKGGVTQAGARGGSNHFHVTYQPIINHPVTRDDLEEHAQYLFGRMRQMSKEFNS